MTIVLCLVLRLALICLVRLVIISHCDSHQKVGKEVGCGQEKVGKQSSKLQLLYHP